jgi:trk system potassium uptake protein TrkA
LARGGKSGQPDEVLVIGLGRFGGALAETLVAVGHSVLGVDENEDVVQAYGDLITHAVRADSTNVQALRQIGAPEFRRAVVAIGTDMEASILTTAALVDLGIPTIWAKAITRPHGKILERIGAHRVIFPEHDMGVRLAHSMVGRTLDYIELDQGFALVETTAPRDLVGRSLADAEVRRRFGITVVCIKPVGGQFTYATPDTVVQEGDVLVVAAETRLAEAFSRRE